MTAEPKEEDVDTIYEDKKKNEAKLMIRMNEVNDVITKQVEDNDAKGKIKMKMNNQEDMKQQDQVLSDPDEDENGTKDESNEKCKKK